MFSLKKYCYLLFLATIFVAGCDDNIQSPIPDFPVYLELNLTAQYPTFKNSMGQFLSTEKGILLTANDRIGFGGIVVCSGISLDDNGNSQYYAFDMACPYEVKNNVKVYPDTTGMSYLICQKCGSVFDVGFGNGNPISGPAKHVLKKYRASLSTNILYINR